MTSLGLHGLLNRVRCECGLCLGVRGCRGSSDHAHVRGVECCCRSGGLGIVILGHLWHLLLGVGRHGRAGCEWLIGCQGTVACLGGLWRHWAASERAGLLWCCAAGVSGQHPRLLLRCRLVLLLMLLLVRLLLCLLLGLELGLVVLLCNEDLLLEVHGLHLLYVLLLRCLLIGLDGVGG